MIVKTTTGRKLLLNSKGLFEPDDTSHPYWMPLIEFRKAYRNNSANIRIFRATSGMTSSLIVGFRKPKGTTPSPFWTSTGHIGCCEFSREEFFKIYRKAFNKTVTKRRAAKAGA